MAITTVGTPTTGSSAAATSTSFATTFPTGWAANDVAILTGHVSATTLTMTPSTGWTAVTGITNPTNEGANSRIYVWYRVLQAGDTAPTITNSGATTGGWTMAAYRGVDTSSPIGQAAAAGTAAVTSRALPSLTGVLANSYLHAVGHARVATGTIPNGLNWNAAYTETNDVATSRATTNANIRFAIARRAITTAGNYGGETVTVANTISSSMITALIELKEAVTAVNLVVQNASQVQSVQNVQLGDPNAPAYESMHSLSDAPSSAGFDDGQPIVNGVTYYFTQAGFVAGIRWYAPIIVNPAATYEVALYDLASDTSGLALATASVSGAYVNPGVWNDTFFSSPVAVSANKMYRTARLSPNNYYVATANVFTVNVGSGSVRGVADNSDPTSQFVVSNSTYRYSAVLEIPTSNFGTPDYFVDVLFYTSSAIGLTVADAAQAQTAAAPALTQVHALAADAANQSQTATALSLTQVHNLAVQDAFQAQTSDSPNLAQVHALAVAAASQTQTAESPTLMVLSGLAIQDAFQAQTSTALTLVQVHNIVVQDAAQAQTSDSPTLVLTTSIVVQDATQAQTATAPALAQVHVLTVASATQAQTAEAPALTQVHNLAVADANQAQAADTPSLAQAYNLTVQDATQSQTATAPALTQVHNLAVGGAIQAQTAEQVDIEQISAGDLAVSSARQAQTSDNVTLVVNSTLAINNASQVQSSGVPTLAVQSYLAVGDANQAQAATAPILTQIHQLAVDSCLQALTSDNVLLFQVSILVVQNAVQAQRADGVALNTDRLLIVSIASDGPVTGRLGADGPVIASLPRI